MKKIAITATFFNPADEGVYKPGESYDLVVSTQGHLTEIYRINGSLPFEGEKVYQSTVDFLTQWNNIKITKLSL